MATLFEMDKAASAASDAVEYEDRETFLRVARWWEEHYRQAGHKRLARIILDMLRSGS
jgi:hypothetical protein